MKTKKSKFVLPTLDSSYLIQRLDRPIKITNPDSLLAKLGADNPFAFGGGYRNGGLSKEAMDLLRDIFTFDYMGAAEFEWGAVPKAFQKIAEMADAKVLSAFSFEIPYGEIEKPHNRRGPVQQERNGIVYVLCPQPWAAEVERRIRYYAKNAYGGKDRTMMLKEVTFLNRSLLPVEEWDTRHAGWLELDNGYMFFTDEEMWTKTCDLFGVER